MAAPSNEKFMLALCQTAVSYDKKVSIANARSAIEGAAAKGAQMIILGEMFSCPYATKYFREYGEVVPGPGQPPATEKSPSVHLLITLAQQLKVWIVGGSIPELDGEAVYNTCIVVNDKGETVARHRKAHLFDIDVKEIPGKRPAIKFQESETLSPGQQLTTFDTPWCCVALGICYDLRFSEAALAMRSRGAKMFIYPGAFNMTTGPAHWEILAKGRAVDNQAYVALCSPARSEDPKDYQAYGHSMLVSPWGDIKVEAEHQPGLWLAEVEPSECDRIRDQIPISKQKRADLYEIRDNCGAKKQKVE
jgi:omega-amidase